MTENAAPSLIAKRLNHLLETVHPAGRGPYSLREVADAINEAAGTRLMSAAYLSQLRTGQRTEPSHSRLAAIAKFFGVDVPYFTDEDTAQATDWRPCGTAASGLLPFAPPGCRTPHSKPSKP